MAFGKHEKDPVTEDAAADAVTDDDDFEGPFDVEDFDDASVAAQGRLDRVHLLDHLAQVGLEVGADPLQQRFQVPRELVHPGVEVVLALANLLVLRH